MKSWEELELRRREADEDMRDAALDVFRRSADDVLHAIRVYWPQHRGCTVECERQMTESETVYVFSVVRGCERVASSRLSYAHAQNPACVMAALVDQLGERLPF